MPTRRSRVPAAAPISDRVAAVLLGAWGVDAPTDDGRPSFAGGYFELFTGGDPRLVSLWRAHEDHLRALAREWGWVPRHFVAPENEYGLRFVMSGDPGEANDGHEGPFFYAEALALAGSQQK